MTDSRGTTDGGRPLHVGVVVTGLALNGGLERCVLEDTTDLVAAGHRVEVWHRDAHAPRPAEGRAPFDRLGVRLIDATDYRFGVRTAFRDAWRFAREGLRIRRSRLDVLWLNRPEYLPFGRIASLVAGVPLAVHLHHAPNYRRIRPFSGGRTRFFAVSQAMADAWREVGAPADRISMVPNGVDTDAFPLATPDDVRRARATLGIDEDTPTVLYYGRLTRSKGVVALLEAWGRLLTTVHARTPETVPAGAGSPPRTPLLVLAGALYPTEADAVNRAIAALPPGSVLVLPERDDVVPLLHAADLVVAPSIEPEGYGRVVVEAMSTGRPVVAAESGGTGEILAGEWARFTVDPTDPQALARTVLEALDESAQDPSLAARCRAFVRERHGRGPHLDALVASLRELAER